VPPPTPHGQRHLVKHDGGREDSISGREVLDRIYDLIRESLPLMDVDDPVRLVLARLAPDLARAVGRPLAEAMTETETRRQADLP